MNRRKPKTDKTAILKIGQKTKNTTHIFNKTISTTERNVVKTDNTTNSSHSVILSKETNNLIKKISPVRPVLNNSEVRGPPHVHETPGWNPMTGNNPETKQTDSNATYTTKDTSTNTIDKRTSPIKNSVGQSPTCARAAPGANNIDESNTNIKQTYLNDSSPVRDLVIKSIDKSLPLIMNNYEGRSPPRERMAPGTTLTTKFNPIMQHSTIENQAHT